jgi:hypothetical protein
MKPQIEEWRYYDEHNDVIVNAPITDGGGVWMALSTAARPVPV